MQPTTSIAILELYLLSYSSFASQVNEQRQFENQENACAASSSGMVKNCGLKNDTATFATGTICTMKINDSYEKDFICNNGSWSELHSDVIPYRGKRQAAELTNGGMQVGAMLGGAIGGPLGAGIGGAVGFLVGGIICIFACHSEDPAPPHYPPVFDCNAIKIDSTMVADDGQTTKTITFGPYYDKSGNFKATSHPKSPATLQRGNNQITFIVKDDQGFESTCIKTVNLNVLTCDQPKWPDHGYIRCKRPEILSGDTCTISCFDGYEITPLASSTITCKGNTFDKPVPTCSMIHCTNTTFIQPNHGHAFCDDSSFPYGTVCVSECNKGYATESTVFSRCKQDKRWSSKLRNCEDREPPKWTTCPSTLRVTADKGRDVATVTWTKPTAVDNSGQQPSYTQTNGKPSGSSFDGFSQITYTASDTKGNKSPPCTFFIFVEKKFCNPPVFNGDQYLRYTCDKHLGYQYGSVCDITCQGSYPLVGNNKMTCELNATSNELYWDWGVQGRPYCKQNKCPALNPPKNGALACDKWMYGTQCTLQCNDKYDIPIGIASSSTFTGLFTCSTSTGKWNPEISPTPECTVRRIGHNHRIPGELIYSGDCNDLATQTQIKQNFVNHMQTLEKNPGYKGVCPSSDICSVENVEVICGSSKKKRRAVRTASDEITLTFEFVRKYEEYGNSTVAALQNAKTKFEVLKNITQGMMNQGLFDVPHATIDKTSFQLGEVDIDCGPGRYPKYSTLTCGACAQGSYLDKRSGKCISCKQGTYKSDEDALSCSQCPVGYSTESNGTTNLSQCLEICKPGYFSTNGLAPCTPCPQGTYSTTSMALTCIPCGQAMYTSTTGSTTSTDCAPFDLSIRDASIQIPFKNQNLQSFTLTGWFSFLDVSSSIEVSVGKAKIQLSSGIKLSYGNESFSIRANGNEQLWRHISFAVSSAGDLTLYSNGASVLSKRLTSITLLQYEINLHVVGGIEVSSLGLFPSHKTANEVAQMSKTCVNNNTGSVLIMDTVFGRNMSDTNIAIVTPSRCDAVNDCDADPCNGHICHDKLNGYECVCSRGYTGQNCSNPPDFCRNNDCENGATCHQELTNYTCICPDRFSGTFCEIAPVDGGWSDWSTWMPCSVSCGGGQTSRFRNCTNPSPSHDGHPCTGQSTENKRCNMETCPTCPRKPSAYGVRMHCNTTNDKHICTATCRAGLSFVPGHPPLKEYICGRETNYTWNANPPSCSKIDLPSTIAIHSTASFPAFPCEKENDAKKEILDNAKTGLQCGRNNTCSVDIKINGCGERQKRSTNVQAVLTLTIPIQHGDLELDKLVENNTISTILANAIKAIADIEASAQEINKTHKVFQLTGMHIDVNNIQVQINNAIICHEGQIRTGTFCIDCPTGTFHSSSKLCEPCPYGTYQDQTGQTKCKQCPDDFTTAIKGSKAVDLCNVQKPKKTTDPKDGLSSTTVMAIAASVSFAFVIGIVATIYIRKYLRMQSRKKDMGSSLSFNMVKPRAQDAGKAKYFLPQSY